MKNVFEGMVIGLLMTWCAVGALTLALSAIN